MNENKSNQNLTCLKTGSKATIINSYWKNNTAYVQVRILMRFQDTYFQVNRSIKEENIKNQFSYS